MRMKLKNILYVVGIALLIPFDIIILWGLYDIAREYFFVATIISAMLLLTPFLIKHGLSIGWDNSPRIVHSAKVRNNTPAAFAKALRQARNYVDTHPEQAPLITINSWNEWTETSYLQPDNVYGYGYLEAVKEVFVDQK